MKAKRLNKSIRIATLESVIISIFKDREVQLKKDSEELAEEAYMHMYGDIQPTLDKLPQDWFVSYNDFDIVLIGKDGKRVTLTNLTSYYRPRNRGSSVDDLKNTYGQRLVNVKEMRVKGARSFRFGSSRIIGRGGALEFPSTGKIGKKALKLSEDRQKYVNDLDRLITDAWAALSACRTYEQVKENYPDLAKHLPEVTSDNTAIAITNDALSQTIKCCIKGDCCEGASQR